MSLKIYLFLFYVLGNFVASAQSLSIEKDGSFTKSQNVKIIWLEGDGIYSQRTVYGFDSLEDCRKRKGMKIEPPTCKNAEYVTSKYSISCKNEERMRMYGWRTEAFGVETISCANKSSAVFTANEPCPKGYDEFKAIFPYKTDAKRLCVALNAVSAFSIPRGDICPKNFYADVDPAAKGANTLCVRDQRIKRSAGTWACRNMDQPKETEEGTIEQEVACHDLTESVFKIRCDKGKELMDCIAQKLNSPATSRKSPESLR